MLKAIRALETNSSITPAELATVLKVSRDYARTLLRRAREKQQTSQVANTPSSTRTRTREGKPAPALSAINLNPRARVLWFLENGDSPQSAASKAGIPVGEVEFIQKVDQILRQAV
jgi:hypothetical protein